MFILHLYEGISHLLTEIVSLFAAFSPSLVALQEGDRPLDKMITASAQTKCSNRSNEMVSSSQTANGIATQINTTFSAFMSTSELKRKCTQDRQKKRREIQNSGTRQRDF